MSLKHNNVTVKKITHNGYTVKKWKHNGTQIFSSGTTVYYYNGSTYIGSKTYAEGKDVLHPGYSPTKSDYTFIGWSTSSSGGSISTTLTASTETMYLYAMFVPNSYVAFEMTMSGTANTDAKITKSNSKYLYGKVWGTATSTYNTVYSAEKTITINKGVYTAAKAKFQLYRTNKDTGYLLDGFLENNNATLLEIHGSDVSCKATSDYINMDSGDFTFRIGSISYEDYSMTISGGIVELLLTNPTKWQ